MAAAEGVYFFVTDESGEVYSAQEVNGQWKTQTVWKDAKRPIIAMLVEDDGATAFVFGKDFYFKLTPNAKPKPCRDMTQGSKELGEPLRTTYECARVLWDNGESKEGTKKARTQPK